MKPKNNKVCNKIRSVKSWLSQAEENFTQKNDVRGELNLLLAEAELQYLREKESSLQSKSVQALALGTALVLLLGLLGGWAAYDRYRFKNYQKAVASSNEIMKNHIDYIKALSVNLVPENTNNAIQVEDKEVQQTVVYETNKVVVVKTFESEPNKEAFSDDQMRDFVRTAGKTLRGK